MLQHLFVRQMQHFLRVCSLRLRDSRLFLHILAAKINACLFGKQERSPVVRSTTEQKMNDQTSTDNANAAAQDAVTTNTATADASASTQTATDGAAATEASETMQMLEKIYGEYNAALNDFETKYNQLSDAKTAAVASARALVGLKEELDLVEADIIKSFEKVQSFLASA